MQRIQALPRAQRIIIFSAFIIGGVLLIVVITVALILGSFNTGRDLSVALVEGITVREFAILPDDDAYPASVTVGPDGTVYTGSFATGAVWSITPDGAVTEIPGTRAAIGAVTGLTIAPEGSLYVVDQNDASALTVGGSVKRITPAGAIDDFAVLDDERGFLLPDDLALDATGNLYVSDRGRREVLRFAPDGMGTVFWTPPDPDSEPPPAPTGLAYDAAHDALIITDSNRDNIYRVSIATGETETLYEHAGDFAPGLDGVTITPDGTIYAAALAQNGLVMLNNGELEYVVGVFRGISDVAYHANRLYATNFDSYSLIVSLVRPHLPFALDVIELAGD